MVMLHNILKGMKHAEYGQVAYQIKGNDTCSNTVANILPTDPLPTLKGQYSTFKNMVMLYIK